MRVSRMSPPLSFTPPTLVLFDTESSHLTLIYCLIFNSFGFIVFPFSLEGRALDLPTGILNTSWVPVLNHSLVDPKGFLRCGVPSYHCPFAPLSQTPVIKVAVLEGRQRRCTG